MQRGDLDISRGPGYFSALRPGQLSVTRGLLVKCLIFAMTIV